MAKLRVIIRFGFSLIKLCPSLVAGYVLLSFLSQTAIPLALPILLKTVADAFQAATGAGPHHDISTHYLWWLVLTLLLIPLSVLFRLTQTDMDNRMERQIRESLFDKVIHQSPEFFHKHSPGEMNNILNQTSVEAQQALRSLTVDPVLQLATVCIATYLIAHELMQLPRGYVQFVWPLVILMVVFGIVSAVVTQQKAEKPVHHAQREVQMQRFALAGLSDSAVKSFEEIQAMHAESQFSQRYTRGVENLMSLKRRQVLIMELVNSAIGLPTQIIVASLYALIVYSKMAADSDIRVGAFISLAGLTAQLMQPFKTFAVLGIIASSSWPAIEIVTQLLELRPRITDLPGARDIEYLEPTLEARNVGFRYTPKVPPVFDDLTFSVPPRAITGLVGRMGEGKTTFFRLALRFYDPDAGQIRLGGVPTTAFTVRSLRRHAAMMSQFPSFFHDTVRNNFRIAKQDATDEEIQNLCEQTGLWRILETRVSPDPLTRPFAAGMGLSGGEKRLFALTRCLLRNPTFLFLDEPTTNMDNNEKYQLIPMMRAACAGKTVVVVDHDISWLVRFSDHFVVLDRGRTVQQGTSDQLLGEPGVLRDLYTLALPEGASK
jgi:ABC-type multidrug transport system fused ATPase/permease subunit